MTDTTTLPTLGEFLRAEREKRRISVEQMASATRISVKVLVALEANLFSELPAKPFLRGFVSSYCKFLGLDAQDVLLKFDGFLDERLKALPSREAHLSGYAFERNETEKSRLYLWSVLAAFAVLGLGGVLIFKPKLKHSREPVVTGNSKVDLLRSVHGYGAAVASPLPSPTLSALPSPSPVPTSLASAAPSASPAPSPSLAPRPSPSASPVPTPMAAPSVATAPSPAPQTSASPYPVGTPSPWPASAKDPYNSGANLRLEVIKHKVILKAAESVFVRYQTDGRPMTKLPLGKDKILVLKAVEVIRLQVANPDVIQYSYNGATFKALPESGSVKFATTVRGDRTFIFPVDLAEVVTDPFPGAAPLKE